MTLKSLGMVITTIEVLPINSLLSTVFWSDWGQGSPESLGLQRSTVMDLAYSHALPVFEETFHKPK